MSSILSQRLPFSLFSLKFANFIIAKIVLCPFFVSRYLSYRSEVFPWRQVVLPQFWLSRRDSTSSKYGCWGSLCFVVIFSEFFLGFSGRVCSVVGASVFASTIYRCGARHSHHYNLPDNIPSSLRSSCSFLRFILTDTLSALQHSRHTEEGRVNG
jgi:hypothetical protein